MTHPLTHEDLAPHRIVPVLVIDDPRHAVPTAEALAAGGIRCAEITLRTVGAIEAIAAVASDPARRDFVVGAGTVLSVDDVDRSADAGARFVVSPGLDEAVVERARRRGVLAVPGVATAGEIQHALRLGVDGVKLFPADLLGGPAAVRAFAGPFPTVRFMPSGGVDASNARQYLRNPAVFAVGGSWMAPRCAIAGGDFASIEVASALASASVAP